MNTIILYFQLLDLKDWACYFSIMFIVYVFVVYQTGKKSDNENFKWLRNGIGVICFFLTISLIYLATAFSPVEISLDKYGEINRIKSDLNNDTYTQDGKATIEHALNIALEDKMINDFEFSLIKKARKNALILSEISKIQNK